MPGRPLTLDEIVQGGLCMGCGLCAAVAAPERVAMVMTPEGRLRPVPREPLDAATDARINAVCPGVTVQGPDPADAALEAETDDIWGPADEVVIAHASDPDVRYRAASGGILTALGQHLVATGAVDFVLHVGAAQGAPMRSEARVDADPDGVLAGASSRYGPSTPLHDITQLLDRGRPFAVIGKPCDITGVRNLQRQDPRARELIRYALALVCGGMSDLTKSQGVLDDHGMRESELSLFRYRGHGNPGPLRAETEDGRAVEIGYNAMWGDEVGWALQPRCKICPDAIGEVADIAAADCWPGGGPSGEDAGFNAVLVRTARGRELFDAALRADAVTIDRASSVREMDDFQPHQVRKKNAVRARYIGMAAAGLPVPATPGLRTVKLAKQQPLSFLLTEARAARRRAKTGRLGEPPARLDRVWQST
ncbi:coenzyme F420 hydrogenase subunit beta [Limimonas halophila]|uniref:Coenzyme F420 hydrogenase subunit beta n=1 Tax=Limimonas halophila TaxID=1082479 RepID=A0A1G7PZQ7_9PROT|nr:Coenzyme F420 hydrogenase/dehydrogenase, beta subunit C-terminal domain [Limimonas halophila]SDF91744.1 coenzyme F420 hydrogenase subunit beta [Limimonas halophila]